MIKKETFTNRQLLLGPKPLLMSSRVSTQPNDKNITNKGKGCQVPELVTGREKK